MVYRHWLRSVCSTQYWLCCEIYRCSIVSPNLYTDIKINLFLFTRKRKPMQISAWYLLVCRGSKLSITTLLTLSHMFQDTILLTDVLHGFRQWLLTRPSGNRWLGLWMFCASLSTAYKVVIMDAPYTATYRIWRRSNIWRTFSEDTWRNNKVIITPKRRCDVVLT